MVQGGFPGKGKHLFHNNVIKYCPVPFWGWERGARKNGSTSFKAHVIFTRFLTISCFVASF